MQRIYFYITALALALTACKKDSSSGNSLAAGNRLTYVIGDNGNLSLFTAALSYTHLGDTLLKPGPYTVLVPNDNAFNASGYANVVAVEGTSSALMDQIISYHILGGTYYLNELPFSFNQEISTLHGDKMYVTHWVKAGDTILTINGTPVIAYNLPASNGVIQVLSAVLNPPIYKNIHEALSGDTALTFFNEAMNHTGLTDTIAEGSAVYTVFAPTNSAFRALGFMSTDSILATDPAILSAIIKYHVLSDRRFIYDYILSTDASGVSGQTMIDGSSATVTLISSGPGTYSGITIQGAGNTSASNLVRSNILAGNGVVHTIDQVLKQTF
ncbi:fasciclin domain-containing protein [Dinghuibacter silviterrae]|uniref:Putative surface protein with fasciclin (FAS1) repeats n=1 Tax=Dinghuibacter silviterrae TaxID=1539049 RepID=A0A4R8DUD3_9BACT|nr:fasciclin domain-containing protein [Dinghuibacter silviterrae]TDX00761.1 putative surface protein with fasciclin (FAS1) repeats [Dinghuibacter silviterrae]